MPYTVQETKWYHWPIEWLLRLYGLKAYVIDGHEVGTVYAYISYLKEKETSDDT